MSWTMDLYAWLTTCLSTTWTPQSSRQRESRMEMGLKPHGETEDFYDISLDTGTRPLSKWWNSSSTSKCPSTSPDNIFDTELPQLMSSPPATPSFRNSTITPRSYEANPW